jgi:hypothetical protein
VSERRMGHPQQISGLWFAVVVCLIVGIVPTLAPPVHLPETKPAPTTSIGLLNSRVHCSGTPHGGYV